jgi:hypothetical protein
VFPVETGCLSSFVAVSGGSMVRCGSFRLPFDPLALVAFDHQHCGDQDETSHDLPGPVTRMSYGRSATTIAHALKTFEPSSAAKNHGSSLTTTDTGYTHEG